MFNKNKFHRGQCAKGQEISDPEVNRQVSLLMESDPLAKLPGVKNQGVSSQGASIQGSRLNQCPGVSCGQ